MSPAWKMNIPAGDFNILTGNRPLSAPCLVFILVSCVYGLNLLPCFFKLVFQLLYASVHFVYEAVALLAAHVEEAQVVLIGVDFLA